MTLQQLLEKLAESDNVEVHGVIFLDDAGLPDEVEQVDDDAEADFYSVYLHFPGRGVECVADLQTRDDAELVGGALEELRRRQQEQRRRFEAGPVGPTIACITGALYGDSRFPLWWNPDRWCGSLGLYDHIVQLAEELELAVAELEGGWEDVDFYEACDKVAEAILRDLSHDRDAVSRAINTSRREWTR